MFVLTTAAGAQTFTVLHTFTGERDSSHDGAHPMDGVVMDRGGNLYGVTFNGGLHGEGGEVCFLINDDGGCGTVFKLTKRGSSWVYSVLYRFQGPPDGNYPAGVSIGPDGVVYGATTGGGTSNDGSCPQYLNGCGTVFRVQPPANICTSVRCDWSETVLHAFAGINGDGGDPASGDLLFDSTGNNIYGTTVWGGSADQGAVYKLTRSQGGWTESIPYSFTSRSQGLANPASGLIMDRAGDFYGTTGPVNNNVDGVIYQLVPSQSGLTANILQSFQCTGGLNGCFPQALIFDRAGNLLGATSGSGFYGTGTVIELEAANNWNINLLYTFAQNQGGVFSRLTMDAAGNLYGTETFCGGGYGCVFKLTPSGGGYVYSEVYDFTFGTGGYLPLGPVTIDADGNLYGTTYAGGDPDRCLSDGEVGCGTIWKIAP
jgi:uncharacterized repeat protein (TIGR03803 family)